MRQQYYALTDTTDLLDLIDVWPCHPYMFNVLKYLIRCGRKSAILRSDLEKARDYLKHYIRLVESGLYQGDTSPLYYTTYIVPATTISNWVKILIGLCMEYKGVEDLRRAEQQITERITAIDTYERGI